MSRDNHNRKVSYYNTLIFTIVAGVVSVLLLLLLVFKGAREYLPFIITLEVGIFSVIALCITQIIMNESALSKLKKAFLSQISFSTCPDYYTKRIVGDKEICANEYVFTNEQNKRLIMKVYPQDDKLNPTKGMRPLPTTHSYDYKGDEPKYEKFPLTELESDKTLKTPSERCGPLFMSPTDPALEYLKGYDLVPWTTMRSKCASSRS